MNQDISIEPGIFFAQMGYVLGGLFLVLLGVAIFYTIAHWRLHGQRFEGVILGVRRRGTQFHSVYRYPLPGGELREATSVQGSGSLKGRNTGRRVAIRVLPLHPEEAREAPGLLMWVLAFGLFLGGAWLTYDSVTEWKRGPITWIVVALFAFFAGRKIWRRLTSFLTKMKSQFGTTDPWSGLPLENAETLRPLPQPNRVQIRGANPGRTGVLFCIVGLVVLATAYIPIHKLRQLRTGTRTEGTILRLEANSSANNRYALFPQVQFTNTDGALVSFWDRAGANPSPYKLGDHVTVLYQPGKQDTAMIDLGKGNWEPVIALLLLGTVLLSLGLFTLRSLTGSANPSRGSRQYQM